MNKKATALFICAISCDLISMNVYRYFPQDIKDQIWFIGQSLTILLYVWTVVAISKEYLFLNTISSAWMPLAVNDLYETIMKENYHVTHAEIICGVISLFVILYKMRDIILLRIFHSMSR